LPDFCCEYITTKIKIMKKLALLIGFSFIFFSCEKDYLIPENEVPDWLKAKIKQDEQKIVDSPKSLVLYGCWFRYNWQNDFLIPGIF